MAEIYRGVMIGAAGFERPVVIKKILPELVREEAFTQMLINEAKLAASLTHANIVQILDLGASPEGEYFIVMEQVDGRDLADVMEAEADRGRALGPGLAVHITLEVLRALDYAHTKRDAQGKALNLVHRDISPSNIMISFAGEVKLTDFGIAKRQADVSTIDALKGKLGYLSPEQSLRSSIDGRSDLYSMGIVLYEMVVGERLFAAATARELLALHRAVQRPPSPRSARPDVPIGLDRVAQRALEPKPEKRFQTAGEFADGLAGLQRAGLRAGPEELKALMRVLFPAAVPQTQGRGEGTMLTLTSLAAVQAGAGQARNVAQVRNGQREAPARPAVGTERLANPSDSDPVVDTDPVRKQPTSVAKHRQRSEPRKSPSGQVSPEALAAGRAAASSVPPAVTPSRAAATSDSFFDEGPGMALVATDTEPMAAGFNPAELRGRAVIKPRDAVGPDPGRGGAAFEEDATAPPSAAKARGKARSSVGDNDATLVIDRRKAAMGAAAARNMRRAPTGMGDFDVDTAPPVRPTSERSVTASAGYGGAAIGVAPGPGEHEIVTDAVRERHRQTGAVNRLKRRSGWKRALLWLLVVVVLGAGGAGSWLAYFRYVKR
jgi:serine/threonine protein kinase